MSIEITEVRNARYISPDGDIDLEINHPVFGWIEYTIALDDQDDTIDNNALIALANTIGITPMDQTAWDNRIAHAVKDDRLAKLRNFVDPIVMNPLRWDELTAEKQQEWRDYRRALLDITDQEGYPHNVVWPTQPE